MVINLLGMLLGTCWLTPGNIGTQGKYWGEYTVRLIDYIPVTDKYIAEVRDRSRKIKIEKSTYIGEGEYIRVGDDIYQRTLDDKYCKQREVKIEW